MNSQITDTRQSVTTLSSPGRHLLTDKCQRTVRHEPPLPLPNTKNRRARAHTDTSVAYIRDVCHILCEYSHIFYCSPLFMLSENRQRGRQTLFKQQMTE